MFCLSVTLLLSLTRLDRLNDKFMASPGIRNYLQISSWWGGQTNKQTKTNPNLNTQLSECYHDIMSMTMRWTVENECKPNGLLAHGQDGKLAVESSGNWHCFDTWTSQVFRVPVKIQENVFPLGKSGDKKNVLNMVQLVIVKCAFWKMYLELWSILRNMTFLEVGISYDVTQMIQANDILWCETGGILRNLYLDYSHEAQRCWVSAGQFS